MNTTQRDQGSGSRSIDFEEMAKDFWATRPRRPRHGRLGAGVAAGIAKRYDIDPVLIRLIFVVATIFGGAGLFVYLLGWLFLPLEGDNGSAAEALVYRGRSSVSSLFTLLLCGITIVTAGFTFLMPLGGHFAGVFCLVVLVSMLILLHYSRGSFGRQSQTAATQSDVTQSNEIKSDMEADKVDSASTLSESAELPSPDSVTLQPAPRTTFQSQQPRIKIGLITFAVALIAIALCVLFGFYPGDWLTLARSMGLVTGILGIGLVIGAFFHSGRGLIIPAIILTIGTFAVTTISDYGWHGFGRLSQAPLSVDQIKPIYQLSVGSVMLDLASVHLNQDSSVSTSVKVGSGDITVLVPKTANVNVAGHTRLGNVRILGVTDTGISQSDVLNDEIPDHKGVGTLQLNLDIGIGNIEVNRD